jgi:hypothetical protein
LTIHTATTTVTTRHPLSHRGTHSITDTTPSYGYHTAARRQLSHRGIHSHTTLSSLTIRTAVPHPLSHRAIYISTLTQRHSILSHTVSSETLTNRAVDSHLSPRRRLSHRHIHSHTAPSTLAPRRPLSHHSHTTPSTLTPRATVHSHISPGRAVDIASHRDMLTSTLTWSPAPHRSGLSHRTVSDTLTPRHALSHCDIIIVDSAHVTLSSTLNPPHPLSHRAVDCVSYHAAHSYVPRRPLSHCAVHFYNDSHCHIHSHTTPSTLTSRHAL